MRAAALSWDSSFTRNINNPALSSRGVESESSSDMSEPVTVYVVDDEPIIVTTLAAILNHSGFYATGFTRAEDAIKAAESEGPSLLISDVVMPGMNGVDLAIHLKSMCPMCKILLFSGQAGTDDLLGLTSELGHDFELLGKPVHPQDLLNAIRKL
jgi:DNA-binding NtrC family response regulator